MRGVPQGSMLSERRIGMGFQRRLERRVVRGRNRGLRPRRGTGAQIEPLALLGKPAFERAKANREGRDDLLAGHPAGDGRKHPLA
jgi:hypothetical protein